MLTMLYLGVGAADARALVAAAAGRGDALLFAVMGLLGMGNGAVFQLVPNRFPKEIGVTTGIIGAAGGFGGFFLPNLLGSLKQVTGSFSGGFLVFALWAGSAAPRHWPMRAGHGRASSSNERRGTRLIGWKTHSDRTPEWEHDESVRIDSPGRPARGGIRITDGGVDGGPDRQVRRHPALRPRSA